MESMWLRPSMLKLEVSSKIWGLWINVHRQWMLVYCQTRPARTHVHCMFPTKWKGWGFHDLYWKIHPSLCLLKADWKNHWYVLTLSWLHSATVSEWNFVPDCALERAGKTTSVKWWEIMFSFVHVLFNNKKDCVRKSLRYITKTKRTKLNCSGLFYLLLIAC